MASARPRPPGRRGAGPGGAVAMVRWALLLWPLSSVSAQTLKLSATLTIEKTDDKAKTNDQVAGLLAYAKEKKFEGNVIRFLENTVHQLTKVMDAAKVVEEQKAVEVPKDFVPSKYKVKSMPKLQAKKVTVKKITATDLQKRLEEGKDLNFKTPLLVTNATGLFKTGEWDAIKRHWHAGRIMEDEYLESNFKMEYWPPDKARARLVGNMLQMEDPEEVTFSRWIVICFHGTPAKPKLPGQNTEHCEQVVDATRMVHNASELAALDIFPKVKNALPLQAAWRQQLLEAAGGELSSILGKGEKKWKQNTGDLRYQYFTIGPSGSGGKLRMENSLPFFDVLIHGSKRWLLLTEEEMERVASKAREALEFDKTSAYMFFEEKLPELKEEFGLKKYVEFNQNAGDLVLVPSGWYRVSLALADSISYFQTILAEKATLKATTDRSLWRPQFGVFQLGMCYDPQDITKLPGIEKGSQTYEWLKQGLAQVKLDQAIQGILSVLLVCGSTLALDGAMPQLGVHQLASCSAEHWKQCRKQLQAKLKEKGSSATLAWLPEEAPRSVVDAQGKKADEL